MSNPKQFQRGLMGYATIIAALRDKPMTALGLCDHFGMKGATIHLAVRQLHQRRLIRIAGWHVYSRLQRVMPIYGFGSATDAPLPLRSNGEPRVRPAAPAPLKRIEMISFAAAMEQLREPSTARDLMEATGLCHQTVYRLLKRCKALRLVHIAGWDTTIALAPVPLWRLGNKRNADRPEPRDRLECWREYDVRRRAREKTQRLIHLTAHAPHGAAI